MKNFFRISALFAALGLAAAFAGCSNASGGGPAPVLAPAPAPAPVLPTYTVAFNSNGGSDVASQTVTSGQTASKPADPTKEHFKFVAWCSDQACQTAFDFATPIKNDTILYAKWESAIYTVTFVYNNGSEAQTQSVESGQTAVKPADPTKDHFNFAGWCSDAECQTPFDFATPIVGDTNLYAKWSDLPVYIVTFDLNGGKYGSSDSYAQNVEINQKAMRPASDPTKDDNVGGDVTTKYAFDNWYADAGCGTLFDFDAMAISGATTVYAKWSETKCYAVKIAGDIEHGSVSLEATEHVAAGTLVTLTANPSVGYKLDSYSVTDADSNPVTVTDGKFTMPAGPVTVSATFTAIEYTITCGTSENGTLTSGADKATIGTTVTLTVTANDRYELKKILVKDSSGNNVSVAEVSEGSSYTFKMPASNVTVTSIFRDSPLTFRAGSSYDHVTFDNQAAGPVTYRVNGGNPQTIASGASKSITLTNVGDKVCFYGDNAAYATSSKHSHISFDSSVSVYGNIMSLVDSSNYDTVKKLTSPYSFTELFRESSIGSAEYLLLPATTLSKSCYDGMFFKCNNLYYPPALPATTLAESCYDGMFYGCTSLRKAPELPATTLAERCYANMFFNCEYLNSLPELPAMTLAKECYYRMFMMDGKPQWGGVRHAPKLPATTLAEGCYRAMFYGCLLVALPELPAKNLAKSCYSGMFAYADCQYSEIALELPATTLAESCYEGMFCGYKSLPRVPELPATTLAESCYNEMFCGCTSLTKAPELPATTLAESCYRVMFYGCSNLSSVTCLANNISAQNCTNNWLSGVSSTGTFKSAIYWPSGVSGVPDGWTLSMLTVGMEKVPLTLRATESNTTVTFYNKADGPVKYWVLGGALQTIARDEAKAITLANAGDIVCFLGDNESYATSDSWYSKILCNKDCYVYGNVMSLVDSNDFENAKKLTKEFVFGGLFKGNSHIKNDPELDLLLPATTLTKNCYVNMFSGCAGLTTAPALPATVLAESCYASMFSGCAGLATAPALPATTLVENCYDKMFYGCSNLSSVTCLGTNILVADCTKDWLSGVSPTGAFKSAFDWPVGDSFMPAGWTNSWLRAEIEKVPLVLQAIESDATVTFKNEASGPVTYWVSGGPLQTIASGETKAITLANSDDIVCFLGGNANYALSDKYSNILCDKDCYVYGNIMSLVDSVNYENAKTLTQAYAFKSLFENNDHIKSKPDADLLLPATALTPYCYASMFSGCSGLATAPELPATALAADCYASMFSGCAGLTNAPELPATILTDECYRNMFKDCASLTNVSNLPATTLAPSCYYGMFCGCTSLTSAPSLPVKTLTDKCYYNMFRDCASLTSAPTLPAMTLADECYCNMFMNCASLTNAPNLPAMTLSPGCYYGMFYGCVNLTSAPSLPATTLTSSCYCGMFCGCKSLTSAPELPAKVLAYKCYANMFESCENLMTAPSLPATRLEQWCYADMFACCVRLTDAPMLPAREFAHYCYYEMFYDCENLKSVICLVVRDDHAMLPTSQWLHGVASAGTFTKAANRTYWQKGEFGIPEGWTVVDYQE